MKAHKASQTLRILKKVKTRKSHLKMMAARLVSHARNVISDMKIFVKTL